MRGENRENTKEYKGLTKTLFAVTLASRADGNGKEYRRRNPMATKRIRRHQGETDADFLARAACVARVRSIYATLDTTNGPLCLTCAPFGSHEGTYLAITFAVSCYNCHGQSWKDGGQH